MKDSEKEEEGRTFYKLHVLGMNDSLWDRVHRLDTETWKWCEWVEFAVFLSCLRGTGINIPDLPRAITVKVCERWKYLQLNDDEKA